MFQQPSVSLKMREFIPYVSIAYTQVNATFENAENILKLKQSYLQVWTRNIQISHKINAPYLGKTKAKKILKRQSLNCCRDGTHIVGLEVYQT